MRVAITGAPGFIGRRLVDPLLPDRHELDERAPPGDDFLAEVCSAWEAAARGAADLGVRVAIVRIGIVLGRDGGVLGRMLPLFRLGLGGRLGSGRQWMSWIHVDDLVAL